MDDMLIIYNHLGDINELKILLKKKFYMKDLGVVEKIFWMEIHKDKSARKLCLYQKSILKMC